jgi:hypothetical protein
MQDLTKITTPFGLLDEETRQALVAHGGPYEHWHGTTGWFETQKSPNHFATFVYRVKPQPLTKPTIDWSHVAPEYKWLARDFNGGGFLYEVKPERGHDFAIWSAYCGFASTKGFASYQPGTCDWNDSLVERPSEE